MVIILSLRQYSHRWLILHWEEENYSKTMDTQLELNLLDYNQQTITYPPSCPTEPHLIKVILWLLRLLEYKALATQTAVEVALIEVDRMHLTIFLTKLAKKIIRNQHL